ncbi:G-protein coupled receptor 55 [Microcaecilia unicolor]|uniref:G-protein coupled receptor 55 n=1 Tax=Microcaecilia unicolor TaxID=1415580 RepID=A0A6P7Z5J8_9AMPH|nr:G-protein coupled receptor 55 [Microcaecilia unicolor]
MNASNSCSFYDVDNLMKYFQLAIYIPTFIFGFILNVLALWVFCYSLRKWTETSIYMMNLAASDLLLLLSFPFKIHFSSSDKQGPKMLCAFVESIYFVNTYGSIFIITCISLDRYAVIKHPFKAKLFRSPKKALLICCCIWILVWLGSIPVYDFHGTNDQIRCFHNISDESWTAPIIFSLEVFGFLIPLIIVAYCSIQIIRTLLHHRNVEQKTIDHTVCICIIAANLITFVICFTPSHLGIFLQYLVRQHVISDCSMKQNISLFVQIAMCLANINCCLDAICYYFAAKEFRVGTDRSLILKKTTSFGNSSTG